MTAAILAAAIALAALPPQAPVVKLPRQAPDMSVTYRCECSAECTCGCQEGLSCECNSPAPQRKIKVMSGDGDADCHIPVETPTLYGTVPAPYRYRPPYTPAYYAPVAAPSPYMAPPTFRSFRGILGGGRGRSGGC